MMVEGASKKACIFYPVQVGEAGIQWLVCIYIYWFSLAMTFGIGDDYISTRHSQTFQILKAKEA